MRADVVRRIESSWKEYQKFKNNTKIGELTLKELLKSAPDKEAKARIVQIACGKPPYTSLNCGFLAWEELGGIPKRKRRRPPEKTSQEGEKMEKKKKKKLSKWQLCIKEERSGKDFDPDAMKKLSKLYKEDKCPSEKFLKEHRRE